MTIGFQQGFEQGAARVRFRRAVSLMVMTLLVPGSAQLVAGNRRVGRLALRTWRCGDSIDRRITGIFDD